MTKRKISDISDLLDTPIYNQELMDDILRGIAQNISIEMDLRGLSLRALAEISTVHPSHLCHILSGRSNIGLNSFIKIAYALRVSPRDLLPFDVNKRKTYGERFDTLISSVDIAGRNYLLSVCNDYVKEYHRIKQTR